MNNEWTLTITQTATKVSVKLERGYSVVLAFDSDWMTMDAAVMLAMNLRSRIDSATEEVPDEGDEA